MLTLLREPVAAPVTLGEMKTFLRVAHDDDDATLVQLIAAATELLDGPEGLLRRSLMRQTWSMTMSTLPPVLTLPVGPVRGIEAVVVETDEGRRTVDGHALVGDRLYAPRQGWPVPRRDGPPDAVRIDYVAGHETAKEVPQPLRTAIQMTVVHWYDRRGADADVASYNRASAMTRDMPETAQALVARYRRMIL